jgi:protoheme ferro-lyase
VSDNLEALEEIAEQLHQVAREVKRANKLKAIELQAASLTRRELADAVEAVMG